MNFTWIPFYMEFADKLLRFRNDRTSLINWIYDNLEGHINHFKDDNNGTRVADVDPFTVFAIINRGITFSKKQEICTKFKNFLKITAPVPQDFNGVPEMNNQRTNFMAFAQNRKNGDIERLWAVFEDAVKDRGINASYSALSNQFLINRNLTFGLFWIRPDKYLALDGNNVEALKSMLNIRVKSGFVPYDDYVDIMKQLDAKMQSGEIKCSSYAEFSVLSYKQNGSASSRDTADGSAKAQKTVAYWTYSPGEQASKWNDCTKEGIMCIGWDPLGDLTQYDTRDEMQREIKRHYPTDGSAKNDSLAVWQFTHDMKPGDIVYAKKGRSTIIGRGVVESDYYFDEDREEFKNVRRVKWTNVGVWDSEDIHAMKTLTNVTKYKDYVEKLESLFDTKGDVEYWWLNANPNQWEVDSFEVGDVQDYTAYNDKGNKRQVFRYFKKVKPCDKLICYETHPTKKVKALCEITEGLHEEDGEEFFTFVITEKFANQVSRDELVRYDTFKKSEPYKAATGSLYHLKKEEFDLIMNLVKGEAPKPDVEKKETYNWEKFLDEVYMTRDDYNQLEGLLLRKQNLILQGAPGVGKTFAAKRLAYAIMGERDDDRVVTVQFHQNYSYEDFVMGYKPNSEGGFDMCEGIFYNFCRKAAADKDRKYFFIIDEINRGNLSKIFGELLMLIEKDYRDTPLQMSQLGEFTVPSNVYIIGMMNTADRSLAMIDYALRRRFSFYEMKPAFDSPGFKDYAHKLHDPQLNNLVSAIVALNDVIAKDDSLGTGFCIGHSYLCGLDGNYDLKSIVEHDIIPMLREYWFDNDERFNAEAQKLRAAVR